MNAFERQTSEPGMGHGMESLVALPNSLDADNEYSAWGTFGCESNWSQSEEDDEGHDKTHGQ
jgi:hypothetical protein